MLLSFAVISGSYVHSALTSPKIEQSSKFSLGKYAALVVFRKTGEVHSGLNPTDLGRRLSQHVVGMNPLRIGEYTPPTAEGNQTLSSVSSIILLSKTRFFNPFWYYLVMH